jgi:hypothetical protein
MPTEAGRHRLYETVKQTWGEDNADELMSHLPPVGWGDVATKQDLAMLETRIEAKFAVLETRFVGLEGRLDAGFNGLRAEMQTDLKQHLRWTIGAMVGLTAIFSAVVGVFSFLT